jgi:hypothetical protein
MSRPKRKSGGQPGNQNARTHYPTTAVTSFARLLRGSQGPGSSSLCVADEVIRIVSFLTTQNNRA